MMGSLPIEQSIITYTKLTNCFIPNSWVGEINFKLSDTTHTTVMKPVNEGIPTLHIASLLHISSAISAMACGIQYTMKHCAR